MIQFDKKFRAWKAISGALLGISVAFMDFDDLAWSINMKSYVGFLIAIVMFITIMFIQKKEKLNKEDIE